MAISMADHFKLQKRSQNFERDSFTTLEEMRDFNTNYLPDIFTATCLETGKFYIYNINNNFDSILGYWRELSVDISQWIGTEEITDEDGNVITKTTVGDIVTTVKKNPSGDIIERTGTMGGVTTTTAIDSEGNIYSKIGEKIVEGKRETSITTTETDDDGNSISIVKIIESTPNGTKETITKEITKPNGSKIIEEEVISGGSDGVNVGVATGTRVTTEIDSNGKINSESSKDTSYKNGEEEEWATKEDIDDLYGSLLGGLGWTL